MSDSSISRRRYKKAGLCGCGREPKPGLKTCKVCRERNDKKRQKYIKKGLCYCSKPIDVPGFKRCLKCRKAISAKNREIKIEVIKEYGGKCQCPGGCDVTEPDWLSMDHIFGGGVAHRKELKLIGLDFYRWLKKKGFPKKGFRLLCYNCNLSRGHKGRCPHEVKND
jgi:hypothetical protein